MLGLMNLYQDPYNPDAPRGSGKRASFNRMYSNGMAGDDKETIDE
jgi:hypothetical protein